MLRDSMDLVGIAVHEMRVLWVLRLVHQPWLRRRLTRGSSGKCFQTPSSIHAVLSSRLESVTIIISRRHKCCVVKKEVVLSSFTFFITHISVRSSLFGTFSGLMILTSWSLNHVPILGLVILHQLYYRCTIDS